jgi:hypothetical protein
VRQAVASHPGTPPAALESLAADPRVGVRLAVASRRELPSRLRVELCLDGVKKVSEAAERGLCGLNDGEEEE